MTKKKKNGSPLASGGQGSKVQNGGTKNQTKNPNGGQGVKKKAGGPLPTGGHNSKISSSLAVSSSVVPASHAETDVPASHAETDVPKEKGDLGSKAPQHLDLSSEFPFEPELETVVVEDGNELSDDDSLVEEEYPALPSRRPLPSGASLAPSASALSPVHDGKNGLRPNAWVNTPKKVFMNAGLGGKLSFTPPTSSRVEIKISEGLPKQVVWGWSLLGQYVGFHPGHFLINSMMKLWGVKSKYRVEEGWFIFQFESEEDQDKVLKGGPYFIHGKPMLLKHIPEKFAFNRKDVATVPLWVRMFGLSRTFWTPEVLGRIASHVGKPLFMDPVTDSRKRGSYARVLVEINFAEPLAREVSLAFDDGEVLDCTFLIENEPKYCKGCCSLGHEEVECSFKEKKSGIGATSRRSRTKVRRQPSAATAAANPSAAPFDDRSVGDGSQACPAHEVSDPSVMELPVIVGNVVRAVLDEEEDDVSSDDAFSDEESASGSEAAHDLQCERCASPMPTLPSPEAVGVQQVVEEVPFQVVMTRSQKKEAMKGAKKEAVLALKAPSRGPAKVNPPQGSKKDMGKKDKVSS